MFDSLVDRLKPTPNLFGFETKREDTQKIIWLKYTVAYKNVDKFIQS